MLKPPGIIITHGFLINRLSLLSQALFMLFADFAYSLLPLFAFRLPDLGLFTQFRQPLLLPTGAQPVKAIFFNAQNIGEDLDVRAGENGGTFGPVTVDDGFTVTVADGSVWSVV